MEEKQEFQLGDTLYYVWQDGFGEWDFLKETIVGVSIGKDGIYLQYKGSAKLQRDCGHNLKEAKEIAVKNWYKNNKSNIKKLRELKE